jgi:hypothetical protein
MDHLIGKTVSRVRRVLYVFQGVIEEDEGPLELGFQDGSVALFDFGACCRVQVTNEEWSDAFAPPLSDENVEYIRTHGKWTVFDISDTAPASLVIGRQVSAFREVMSDVVIGGELLYKGVVIEFGELVVEVNSWDTDEIEMKWNTSGAEIETSRG